MSDQAQAALPGSDQGPHVVEVLHFRGCPSHQALMPRLRTLLAGLGVRVVLAEREVATEEAARAERFLGSPTIRVDGVDVEPGAVGRRTFGLVCRLYRTRDGLVGIPPEEWITAKLAAVPQRVVDGGLSGGA